MRCMILPLTLLAFAACQTTTTELSDEQKAEIAAEVNAVHAEHQRAWADADFDKAMSYFLKSPDMIFAFEGGLLHGWDAMYNALTPVFEGVSRQEMTFTETHTAVLAPDAVCITAQGTNAYVDEAGVIGPKYPFALTVVYVLRDGEWKVAFGHESLPTPEAEST